MKIELSAKDIRLLKILLTLLIAVLMIRLLILPAAGRNQTLGYELDEAQQKQEEMQYRINGMDTSRAMVKKAQDSLAELSKPYYGLLEQQEIDEIVTGLAYKHGLFPSRLEIGERMDSRLAPYIYSAEGDGGRKEKSASGTEETGGVKTAGYLQSVDAVITLTGAEEHAIALLDDVEKNYPSIQIRSFDIKRAKYMNTSMALVQETQTSLVLTIYMCDKTGVSE